MAYHIYEIDVLTGEEKRVSSEPYFDRDMAMIDRRWMIKALEDLWTDTREESTKCYQIREL